MSEVLTPEQIAALVEAAKQGQLPERQAATARRTPRVRKVDFSRPTKFTIEHQRRIARAIDTFCQTAATRLSAELRMAVELEVISTTQVTWSGAQSQLPAASLAVMIGVEPIDTRMRLTAEQSFVLMGIECLLGGSPDRPPRERRLSEIDWILTRRLLSSIVSQLSLVWEELASVGLRAGEIELQNEAGQIASVSEPTLVIMIEGRINKHSSALSLLIPWIAIEPIAERLSGAELALGDDGLQFASEIGEAISRVPVTLRAEIASVELPVAEILALGPGSIVRLGARADRGVSVFAENVRLCTGMPGANGARRAVQIRDGEQGGA
jgi:flagellar motor switch protein FliM